MPIHIDLRLDLSKTQKGIVRAAVVTGAVLASLGIGLAVAAPIDTTWIAANQPIPAASLKANLDGLQQQVSKPVLARNGKQYSLNATYCGKTAPTNGQVTNGYAGAKSLCETVAACGNSLSAHMCTNEEIGRSAQIGIPIDTGWYSSAAFSFYPACSSGTCGSGQSTSDCNGWSSNNAAEYALTWQTGGRVLFYVSCNNTQPILCCD